MENPDDFGGPVFQQARRMFEQGRFGDALPLFAESAQVAPHYKTYELYGECLLRSGRPAEAALSLAAACALNRGARPRVLLARSLAQIGRATEARSWLADALERQPGYGPAVAALHELPE
ncbi:MAG: tetratricopeptide repeat protein [Planctomycetes bacterium]|nr:tetratricopeptide repeat protein [Planctomycetota bacterium]